MADLLLLLPARACVNYVCLVLTLTHFTHTSVWALQHTRGQAMCFMPLPSFLHSPGEGVIHPEASAAERCVCPAVRAPERTGGCDRGSPVPRCQDRLVKEALFLAAQAPRSAHRVAFINVSQPSTSPDFQMLCSGALCWARVASRKLWPPEGDRRNGREIRNSESFYFPWRHISGQRGDTDKNIYGGAWVA